MGGAKKGLVVRRRRTREATVHLLKHLDGRKGAGTTLNRPLPMLRGVSLWILCLTLGVLMKGTTGEGGAFCLRFRPSAVPLEAGSVEESPDFTPHGLTAAHGFSPHHSCLLSLWPINL